MAVEMSVKIGAVRLSNPVLLASGCCGYGLDMESHLDLNAVGGVCLKGLSMSGSEGNPPPRICETPAGMLNSIGLQNVGVPEFRRTYAPKLRKYRTAFIANFYGHTVEEYVAAARALDEEPVVAALEMNISCPNIRQGGISFGTDPRSVHEVTAACRRVCGKPLWVKLSPNVTDITVTARAAQDAGADALTCINTLPGMAIDVERRTFKINTKTGGLSGPALRPVAVRMVYQVAQAVKIPVVGIGGISKASDALEFLLAGAQAVQVGTALFTNPQAPLDILEGIEDYCSRHGFGAAGDLSGAVEDDRSPRRGPVCS
ncbi:MAG: dihydroorotate dehydrogenase [Acidobacteriota bacterium]|jgi:dihydroorotate dehydrogenase (NAD+) catalytic subunit